METENKHEKIDFEEKTLNERKYLRAKERVVELKKFYDHLIIYIIINAFLAGFNYYSDQWEYPWFLWPAIGWGVGLAFHAATAFQINPLFNKSWEDRKVREYMEKEEYGSQDAGRRRWE